jgi:hypothetical protein
MITTIAKRIARHNIELMQIQWPFMRSSILKGGDKHYPKDALHIVIPYRTNWKLTEACIATFKKRTTRPHFITVVANFTEVPRDATAWSDPHVRILTHQLTQLAALLPSAMRLESGSKNNAMALDFAIQSFPKHDWVFMAHNDSAPLCQGWDDTYFHTMGKELIIGNYRDQTRIHAAHSSGTLFSQKKWLKEGLSLMPVYSKGDVLLDIGDRATERLFRAGPGKLVPILPNTLNDPSNIDVLEKTDPRFVPWAKSGSTISIDPVSKKPVFGHMGRGTPRSSGQSGSATVSKRLPVDDWIDLIAADRA